MYRIKIDRDRCIGCLTCVTACVACSVTAVLFVPEAELSPVA